MSIGLKCLGCALGCALAISLGAAQAQEIAAADGARASPPPVESTRASPSPIESTRASPSQTVVASSSGAPGVVNINTASSAELERLPGIGPAKARAILELRARLKRFARIEDLLRVKGIGRATFRKLRPHLVLQGESTL
jgi:competence protein ComEA